MLLCRLWNIVLCASWVAWSRFCFKGNQIKRIIASNIQRKLLKTNLDIIGCPNVDKWATHDALRTRFHIGQIAIQSNINSNICVKFGCYTMCSFWRYWIFLCLMTLWTKTGVSKQVTQLHIKPHYKEHLKGGEESLKTIQNLFPLAKEEVTKGNTEKVGIFGSSKMPQNTRLSIHCTHSYRDRLGLHSLSVFFSGG